MTQAAVDCLLSALPARAVAAALARLGEKRVRPGRLARSRRNMHGLRVPGTARATSSFSVSNPYEINEEVWKRLPPAERSRLNQEELASRCYEPAERGRFRADPDGYATTFSIGHCAELRLSRIADARGTAFTVREPGLDGFCISFIERGAVMVESAGVGQSSVVDPSRGLIFSGKPATRFVTSDDSERLQLWVPGALLRRALEAQLASPLGKALEFAPSIDWSRGGGASLRRLIGHAFAEIADPGSLLASGIGAIEFQELLVQSLLFGAPHNYFDRVARQQTAAAPGNVRRAEEFLRANCEEAVTIERIAQAAGCSVRALQLAFRRFRKITPTEALRRVRLDQARAELLRSDGSRSVTDVAAQFLFANPGRFARQFKYAFGEYPSDALRQRAGLPSPPGRAEEPGGK